MDDFGMMLRQLGRDLSGASNMQNTTPSALQELAAFQTMTPEQQKIYWNIKRAAPVVNLGGSQAILSPQGTGEVTTSLPVSLKPEDVPENAAAKSAATSEASAKGAEIGKAEGAREKKYIQAPQIDALLTEAEKLLPKATSGGADTAYRDIAAFFNEATPGSTVDSSLDVIGNTLTASVPRFEGPQGVLDVKLYEKSAGDLANSKKPYETRLSALKTIRELNNRYMNKGGAAVPAASGQKVRVQNPQGQVGTIDASELPDAIANGWKQL